MTSPHTIRNHRLRESEAALPPGQWVTRRGIQVFKPDQPALEFIDTEPWPRIKLCAVCDTAHRRSDQCPTCRQWADRAAEQWAWEQARKSNRDLIWNILDARRSVAA